MTAQKVMPALFIGHGSPMNAVLDNEATRGLTAMGKTLPKPKAILCISAHWETKGTWLTAMEKPKTIYDFGGFPPELYQIKYPAQGNPVLAEEIQTFLKSSGIEVGLDHSEWGLDHGAWSILKWLFPEANVPVLQLSLDHFQTPAYHYRLGQILDPLREQGIMIIGSGGIAHNLRLIDRPRVNDIYGYDWTLDVQKSVNAAILRHDHEYLIDYKKQGQAMNLAIPTPEHYVPLLYILGMQQKNDEIHLFNDFPMSGSVLMTSVMLKPT
jgi:4,5-DOPA dioxygenase extradiol